MFKTPGKTVNDINRVRFLRTKVIIANSICQLGFGLQALGFRPLKLELRFGTRNSELGTSSSELGTATLPDLCNLPSRAFFGILLFSRRNLFYAFL